MVWKYACKRKKGRTWQCEYVDFDKSDYIRLRPGAPPRPKDFYYSKFQSGNKYQVLTVSQYRASHKNICVDQLVEMINNKDFLLINVHVPYEGEISQTDLLIPFNVVEKFKNELPIDKDTKIVLYCMPGHMDRVAAEKLTSMGYTQVHNLQNGIKDWKRNGKQILCRSGWITEF